jgi:hypothetical protein
MSDTDESHSDSGHEVDQFLPELQAFAYEACDRHRSSKPHRAVFPARAPFTGLRLGIEYGTLNQRSAAAAAAAATSPAAAAAAAATLLAAAAAAAATSPAAAVAAAAAATASAAAATSSCAPPLPPPPPHWPRPQPP